MKILGHALCLLLMFAIDFQGFAQEGVVSLFDIQRTSVDLHRLAQPSAPFSRVGRKLAILGFESGSCEVWAYPLKLLRNFELSFFIGSSTRPILAKDIVRYIDVTPSATIFTFTHQSFTVKANYIAAIDEPCAMILLTIDSHEPLTIVCSFLPVLQPMWPAGIGGQYAYWNDHLKYYLISEPTRENHAFIGSPAAMGISYTPAHMLSDVPNEFKITINDPQQAKNHYIPIYIAGGKGNRDSLKSIYQKMAENPQAIYQKAQNHYDSLLRNTLQVTTPHSQLNLAFAWCKLNLDNMVVDNVDLGKGLIAGLGASGTSGRPGFGWFFGGDAYINSLALNSTGSIHTTRDALAFTQKWQRKDGKMAHELSQAAGYIDWWGKYPYGYIHGDTTPFFIVAVYDYFIHSGDSGFVRTSWNSLLRAYQWCLSTDENNDGLMDNPKAGLGSVEYGALTNLRTDIFLGALSVRMSFCMNELAQMVGDKKIARLALNHYQKSSQVFDEKFWDAESVIYSNAFNDRNEHIKEISPWIGFPAVVDVGDSAHTLQSLYKLSSAELTTDWGIRSISNKSKYFGALNYNYGAVWPFLSGFVTLAQFKHQLWLQGYTNMEAIAQHVFDNQLGAISEVYSGAHNIWPQEAVAQQGFSATGFLLPFTRGLLGLDVDVPQRKIYFSPQLPEDWAFTRIDNLRGGNATFSIDYQKTPDELVITLSNDRGKGFSATVAPSFSIGSQIVEVKLDDSPRPFHLQRFTQTIRPVVEFPINAASHCIRIRYRPGLSLLPVANACRTGDANRGLKIISLQQNGEKIDCYVQGVAGFKYTLRSLNPSIIKRIEGGTLQDEVIEITFPAAENQEFMDHIISFYLKQP